jgi:hypothetical protein
MQLRRSVQTIARFFHSPKYKNRAFFIESVGNRKVHANTNFISVLFNLRGSKKIRRIYLIKKFFTNTNAFHFTVVSS